MSMEIQNVGCFYGGTTIDELKCRHSSRRRNERIAQVFHMRKLIQSFGGGTRRIYRLCEGNNLVPPEMAEESDGFVFRFYYKQPIGPSKINLPTTAVVQAQCGARQKEILELIAKFNYCTSSQILEHMSNPPSDRTLRSDLVHLESLGLVKRQGGGRSTLWSLA